MNYYPFHIGDYTAATAHLEPIEDIAYRRMLDVYYTTEKPLPKASQDVARLIRMKSNLPEVETVLNEFFSLDEDGWRHSRCEEEIQRFHDQKKKQVDKAKKRWEKERAMPKECCGNAAGMPTRTRTRTKYTFRNKS